jgi:hypothetical protein
VQDSEIAGSRARLTRAIGVEVTSFAYPFGIEDDGVRDRVRRAGYAQAVTTRTGAVTADSDPLRLPRLEVKECGAAVLERAIGQTLAATHRESFGP